MIYIKICVGSSCHLKGSQKLVELLQARITSEALDGKVMLMGSFCLGKCNREGVTISVGNEERDEVYTGITPDGFEEFWTQRVATRLA